MSEKRRDSAGRVAYPRSPFRNGPCAGSWRWPSRYPMLLAATLGGLRVRTELAGGRQLLGHRQAGHRAATGGRLPGRRRAPPSSSPASSPGSTTPSAPPPIAAGRRRRDAARGRRATQADLTANQQRPARRHARPEHALRDGRGLPQRRLDGRPGAPAPARRDPADRPPSSTRRSTPSRGWSCSARRSTAGFSLAMQQASWSPPTRRDTGNPSSCSPSSASRAPPSTVSASALGDSEPSRRRAADRRTPQRFAHGPHRRHRPRWRRGLHAVRRAHRRPARRHRRAAGHLGRRRPRQRPGERGASRWPPCSPRILLALLVSRLLLNPIRRVREGALDGGPRAAARGGRPDPRRRGPGRDHADRRHHARGDGPAGPRGRRPAPPGRHLASGEAKLRAQVGEMFVTLSRRNTSLINQQLGLIETLEKDEEDPRAAREPVPPRPPGRRGCVVRPTAC